MIGEAALQELGREIRLAPQQIEACLDPARNVAARRSLGGPAPSLVRARIGEQRTPLQGKRSVIEAAASRAREAQALLQQRIGALISSETGTPAFQGA
jgi:argininosuccinate lyase